MNQIKLAYGLKEGRLWHVDEVENGIACGCTCPKCGAALNARNGGKQVQHHFAHVNTQECVGAVETAMHLYAKQILCESKQVSIPEYDKTPVRNDLSGNRHEGDRVFRASDQRHFNNVKEEVGIGEMRVDAVGYSEEAPLLIEVMVTHAVDSKKAAMVRRQKSYMIEIDLSYLDADVISNPNFFRNEVIHNIENKAWISHPEADTEYKQALERLKAQIKPINDEIQKQREVEEQERVSYQNNRARFRGPYEDDLKLLEQAADVDWQRLRMIELETNAYYQLNAGLGDSAIAQNIINHKVKFDWIFNVHRIVWQDEVYKRYIQDQPVGTVLNANEIKKWVVKKFGILDFVERLNNIKQKGKAEGKARGKRYGSTGAWFFSDHENYSIPSPYQPVIKYLEALQYLKVLGKGSENGEFLVCLNTIENIEKYYLEMENARKRREQEYKIQQERALQLLNQSKESAKEESEARIKQLLDSEQRVIRLYNINARRCLECHFTSHEQDGENCPFCNGRQFENHLLSDGYLKTAYKRYWASSKILMSIRKLSKVELVW